MRKIAIIQKDLTAGGIQKSLINLLNNIDLNKYEIDLYLFYDNNFFGAKLPQNINVIYLKPKSSIFKLLPFSIGKLVNSYKIDKTYDMVIDFNSYDFNTALLATCINAPKKVMWIHSNVILERQYSFKYNILWKCFKSKYKYFNTYVGVSNGVIKPFQKLNPKVSGEFYVIPNIIDTEEIISKAEEKVDLDIDQNKINLVSVGRLCFSKGFDILIKKFKEVINKNKNFHLYIIGEGEEKRKLYKLICKLNLNEYITLLGAKPNPYKYLKQMDAFAFTSRYEGQGLVIMEAKTLGLDLIVSENLKETVENINFSSDIVEDILKLKKKDKKIDLLYDYNEKIKHNISNLFNI